MKIFGSYRWIGRAALLSFFLVLSACASKQLEGPSDDSNLSVEKQDAQKRASIRMQLAISYYQQGQYKVALDEIKHALAISPDLVDAYSVRALIFMGTGEKKLAEDNFLYALKLAPDNLDIANNYGWFLCQNKREKEGLTYLQKVLQSQTYASSKAYNAAGMCSLNMGDNAAAEKYFMQGFRVDPANSGLNTNLARTLFLRGEYAKARFYIGRVIQQDVLTPDVLWLAIKIEHKLRDDAALNSLSAQLRKRYPDSPEFSLLQRGLFDE
ncbi:type IV pilus biogenesis/stability protein PilW [Undibacterium sp. Dicai25W]|uniref:type IV pilus biogenesis/stability protein PilW n=1 Tax=Undibacterium sp. Dicai25W TaxID=3413034 RepID=UPI003BF1AA7A